MDHQTVGWWDDRPSDPAYYFEECGIFNEGKKAIRPGFFLSDKEIVNDSVLLSRWYMSENSKEFWVVMKVVQETATQNTPPAKRARWNWKKYTSNKKGASRFILTKSIHIISCADPT